MRATTAVFLLVLVFLARPAAAQSVAPVIVVETSRGTVSVETFPGDAPLTVAHVVALVKSGFYDGQRVHRAIEGFVVQFGDPQTRDMSTRARWGRGAALGAPHLCCAFVSADCLSQLLATTALTLTGGRPR